MSERRHFTRYLYDTIEEAMARNPAGIHSPVFRQPIWTNRPVPMTCAPCAESLVEVAVCEVRQLPEYGNQWSWERVS
jgi:hypothetical protein